MGRDRAALALVLIGALQMAGWATGQPTLRGIGAITVASPLPLVFSAFRGVETFAADFAVELEDASGIHRHALTPALYARLGGPYNWRNVFGAALAYGPALDAPNERRMVDDVLRFGLCDGPLARGLGAYGVVAATVSTTPRTAGVTATPWRRRVGCTR